MSEKVTLLEFDYRNAVSTAKSPPDALCSVQQRVLSVHALLSTMVRWALRTMTNLSEVRAVDFALS